MKVRYNWCNETFDESEIIYNEQSGVEYCPHCNETGYLMDLEKEEK